MSTWHSRRTLGTLAVPAVLSLLTALPGLTPTATAQSLGAAGTSTDDGSDAPRPNIVYVMADDLGWSDLGTGRTNLGNGNDFNETPAIDRLADEGQTFDNAYACLNCAPTRAALLTGLYAPRPDNNIFAVDNLNRGGDDTLLVGPPEGREDEDVVLPAGATTVAETLQGAGYATGYVGKFHVAKNPDAIVTEHGFDENFGGGHAGNATAYHASNGQFNNSVAPSLDAFAADYTQEYVDQNIKPYAHGVSDAAIDALVGTDKHVTDALGDAAIDFIGRHKQQPFLTYFSEFAVHSPNGNAQARTDLLAKYQAKPAGEDPVKPSYAALTEGLDQSVDRVVRYLETTPDPRNPGHDLADNTLVIFTSDNGGREDLGGYNGPLKGQKGELDEGGVRVPWIVWSQNPALVRSGTTNSSPINGTDLYPTLADYAGAELPAGVPFDGVSLRDAYASGARVNRPRFEHMPGYLVEGGRDQRPETTVRDGRWKLGYEYETQTWHLYDLVADIGETTDLVAQRPDVVTRLGGELLRWLDSTDAPLATLREGKAPIDLTVRGTTYSDGQVRQYQSGATLRIEPGDPLPVVLQRTR
jgi:arylsulfatase A-like enzyme